MSEVIIKVNDLCLSYNGKPVLKNINTVFQKGEAVLIAGKNGSGKSTFLKCLMGVLLADSGKVFYSKGISKKNIGFISENMSLLENYTLNQGINFHKEIYEIQEFDDSLIKELNLDTDKRIKTLSAGERAIFHLSLLISQRPDILLVDEIIHAIDPFMRELFLETLIGLMDELNTTVIMVNHTFSDTGRIPERILLMEEGKFILDEKREDLKQKIKKVVSEGELEADIPVIFKKESFEYIEYYVFPFKDKISSKFKHDFLPIDLTEIIKAFIGGYYVKKRG